MNKLGNNYIDRMIDRKTSRMETLFILYIARSQDEHGFVPSVYYKDVCEKIGCSIQKFYDILFSLSDKSLIHVEKYCETDVSIRLTGNDFSDENFQSGYINVSSKDFFGNRFRNMHSGSMLLYLYTQRFVEGKHMLVQNFYEEFCQLFHVAKKTMQLYLQELKERMLLFISKKRNKALHFEITFKRSSCLDLKDIDVPHEKEAYLKNLSQLIRLNFSCYLPDGATKDQILKNISNMADSQRARKENGFFSLMVNAIKESIHIMRDEGKKKILLNAALINKCLTDLIDHRMEQMLGIT